MRGRSKNLITLSTSVNPVKIYLAILVLTVRLFSSLLPVSQTVPVTRQLQNPNHFFAYSRKREVIHKIQNCPTGRNFAFFRQIVLPDKNKSK